MFRISLRCALLALAVGWSSGCHSNNAPSGVVTTQHFANGEAIYSHDATNETNTYRGTFDATFYDNWVRIEEGQAVLILPRDRVISISAGMKPITK